MRTYVRRRCTRVLEGGAGARAARAGRPYRRRVVSADRARGGVRAAAGLVERRGDVRPLARLAVLVDAARGTRARADRKAVGGAAVDSGGVLSRGAVVREGERVGRGGRLDHRGAVAGVGGGNDGVPAGPLRRGVSAGVGGGGGGEARTGVP